MTFPVAPELFDVLTAYVDDIRAGKIKPTPSIGDTSPALTFCENFYAQFFQNRLQKPITTFTLQAKEDAIRILLSVKDKVPAEVTLLITWFEKLCDDYADILALGYGTGTRMTFYNFHNKYLLTLLDRAAAWAKVESFPEIENKARKALEDLRQALQSIPQ